MEAAASGRRIQGGKSDYDDVSPQKQQLATPAVVPGSSTVGRLNAKDFGAVGDGKADDAAALQRAIDVAQTLGEALYIPGGCYSISAPLRVHCKDPFCAMDTDAYNTTMYPLVMQGAGMYLTHIVARADAPRLQAILFFESRLLPLVHPGAQPEFNCSRHHEVSDIHLAGGASLQTETWQGWPADRRADYGIYAPGLTRSIFIRVQVTQVAIAGFRAWYCWWNRFEFCNFHNAPVGIHSACNNLHVVSSTFASALLSLPPLPPSS